MEFKQKFIEKYSRLTDFEEYKKAIQTNLPRSIRINTLKISVDEAKEKLRDFNLKQVPWCNTGFYIEEEKRDIGTTKEHKEGMFFIQSSVSMIPSMVLNPNEKDIVLDVSASPGGKTSHLASLMNNRGIMVANDINPKRIRILELNLERCSVMNTIITMMDGRRLKGEYDKILLDAPCTASGNIVGNNRETRRILNIWNENSTKKMSMLQKDLIEHTFSLLKDNGILVYSTCSLEPEEDEEVVDYLLNKNNNAKLEDIDLDIKVKDKKYFKIWPQDNNTEGFFVAKIRKI